MNPTELRINTISEAEEAFNAMLTQVHRMLEVLDGYIGSRWTGTITASDRIKVHYLLDVVEGLGSLPDAVADTIERWKRGDELALSRFGVETQLLNELLITLEVTTHFLMRENWPLGEFYLTDAKAAHGRLVQCNMRLTP